MDDADEGLGGPKGRIGLVLVRFIRSLLFHRSGFITKHLRRKTYRDFLVGTFCGTGEYSLKTDENRGEKSA